MAEKLLEEILRHVLVGQVLRHRVAEEMWVDVLGDSCLDRNLLYKLLKASR